MPGGAAVCGILWVLDFIGEIVGYDYIFGIVYSIIGYNKRVLQHIACYYWVRLIDFCYGEISALIYGKKQSRMSMVTVLIMSWILVI